MTSVELETVVTAKVRATTSAFVGSDGMVRIRVPGTNGAPPKRVFPVLVQELGAFLRRVRLATAAPLLPLTQRALADLINERHRRADEPAISAGIIARTEDGGHVRGVGFVHLMQMVRGLGLTLDLAGASGKWSAA